MTRLAALVLDREKAIALASELLSAAVEDEIPTTRYEIDGDGRVHADAPTITPDVSVTPPQSLGRRKRATA